MSDFEIPPGMTTARAAREDIELCLAQMCAEIVESIDAIEGLDDAEREDIQQRLAAAMQRARVRTDPIIAKYLRPKES